ncbi:MAG: zf-HC2 domain-containing protein [Candidatus Methylomirabilales bacterium]
MRCEEIQDHLSAYLEDEVGPSERRAIEGHLLDCVRCRHELDLFRQTVSALQSMEEIDVPARLTAAIEADVSARKSIWWQDLISRLFVPMHIKIPLQAAALVLISLGAVYLYRSSPELAQAPRPSLSSEKAPRGQIAAPIGGGRQEADEVRALKRSLAKSESRPDVQEEREALGEKNITFRDVRKEAAADAVRPLRELSLKTDNPSQAATRIAEIAERMGGRLLETRDQQLILTIPAKAYPKFLAALRDVGAPLSLETEAQAGFKSKAEPPAKPQEQARAREEASITVFLRLSR